MQQAASMRNLSMPNQKMIDVDTHFMKSLKDTSSQPNLKEKMRLSLTAWQLFMNKPQCQGAQEYHRNSLKAANRKPAKKEAAGVDDSVEKQRTSIKRLTKTKMHRTPSMKSLNSSIEAEEEDPAAA